ncbi:hypothetical protein [Acinetobacter sp. RF14B]|uniref:hypothetical protein n=1 Tax=Acinetobacter sp. RF14B TaxID=2650965 RepID=UPI001D0DA170|nr:hypothetical protein [Acinetobacter sp. RF14B]
MQSAQPHLLDMPSPRSVLMMSALCLNLLLLGCSQNESAPPATTPQTIELIPQDLVAVKAGNLVQKTAFTGTIRAVNQSSIQAQVTATATSVNAQVGQTGGLDKKEILLNIEQKN